MNTNTIIDPEIIAPARPRPVRLAVDVVLADVPTTYVAKIMGVSERTVQRWRLVGISNGFVADKLAVKVCGTDAYSLWGRDWERASFPKQRVRLSA